MELLLAMAFIPCATIATGDQWSVPINFQVSKLVKVEDQPISFTAGARYWAAAPESGPQGWGFRLAVTFLFPK